MLLDLMDALKHQGDSRPFELTGELPPGSLPDGIIPAGPVTLSGTMTAIGQSIALVGQITASAKTNCALCQKPVTADISCQYNELLRRQGLNPGETADGDDDEAGESLFFEGTSCELDTSVAQAINLYLPMRHLCKADCKGLCPQCGADMNEGECGCDTYGQSPFAVMRALFPPEGDNNDF